ncbi:hypothetical protein [Bacillus pacificus]|uniref:hypothetical protein n=1 Tax=Bacillus pacificus TaxID=2026187 RepID=UPI00397AA5CD
MYEDLFNRHPYIVIGRNHPVFDFFAKEGYAPIKAEINIKMLDMILFEQFIQQIRYLYIHNLNNDFKMSSHYRNSKYAGFNFNCPKYDIVQIDDSKNALAVHNAGGSSLKSIYKDVLDLPNEAEIKFKVNISSLKIGREVEINIYELEPHTKKILEKEPTESKRYVINENWQEITRSYTKKYRDTIIRFEIYWFDDEPLYLFVTDVSFTYCPVLMKSPTKIDWINDICLKIQETPDVYSKETLPFLSYYSWGNRSTNKALYFGFSDEHITTQWLAANNSKLDFQSPSYIYDLPKPQYAEWNNLDFTFEVFIKSAEDIGTEILLAIQEFDGDAKVIKTHYANNGTFQKITHDWKLFSVKCNRSSTNRVRCEVYWKGDNKSDVLIRDSRILYHKKE